MWQWLTGIYPSNNSQDKDNRERKREDDSNDNDSNQVKDSGVKGNDKLKSFQQHYIGDYVADKESKLLKKHEELIGIGIHFNFEESYESHRSNIFISQDIPLHNPKQLNALLHHYIPYSSGRYKPVTRKDIEPYDSKYKDLYKEIEGRNASQLDIDGKIGVLSRYLIVDLEDNDIIISLNRYNVTYSNLNTSTLPLAMEHFQYLMLSLRTWSYLTSSIDKIDVYMRYVMRKYTRGTFRIHYVYDPWRPEDSSINELSINLNFTLPNKNGEKSEHKLNKVLCIRNVDKFKVLLNHYEDYDFQRSIPLQPSSAYEYLHDYTTYYNTLQVRMDKIFSGLLWLFFYYIEEDEDDPSILSIDYSHLAQSELPLAIRYLELITRTFKTWNDNTNDNKEMDRFLQKVKEDIYPLIKDRSFGSFYEYYKPITSNTFQQLNLNIILKRHQYNFRETLHLEGSKSFKYLLDSFNYLPNDYVTFTNFPRKSIVFRKDLLYILDRDETDPSILNLNYYPLSNELDISLIIDHLTTMVKTFKREVSTNSIDNNTLDHYLSSIIKKLASLPTLSLPFQKYYVIQYNNRLDTSVSNITINLRLLLRDSRSISNTYKLALTNTDQLLSLLNHYSLRKDLLDPWWMEGYSEHAELYREISRRGKLQTSLDGSLFRLPRDISLKVGKNDSNPCKVEVDYPNLEISSIPYAMKHLELMMLAYKAWNYSHNDKLEVDTFLFQAKEDVEGWCLTISKVDNKLSKPFTSSSLVKSSTKPSIFPKSKPFTSSIPLPSSSIKPYNTFWQPYQHSDPHTVLPSSLTLEVELLPLDNLLLPLGNLTFRDTLEFQDTSRFLSILDHYDLKPNDFNHADTNDFKVSSRAKTQRDIDTTLLDLSNRILFYLKRLDDDPTLYLTYSRLRSTDVPFALLHLELMVRVFRTWSYDRQGKKVLDDFVAKARSTIIPRIPVASLQDDNDTGSIVTTLPIDGDHPQVLGPLIFIDPSGSTTAPAVDDDSTGDNISGNISMMEDVD